MNAKLLGTPGDPEELAKVIDAAERYYESTRKPIVVYWDDDAARYRMSYESLYKQTDTSVEVVKFP
jgi:hypothetical protein